VGGIGDRSWGVGPILLGGTDLREFMTPNRIGKIKIPSSVEQVLAEQKPASTAHGYDSR